MDKYIGKKLDGRYEIKELIGVGGMATVYKAHDILEDRTVAIKILKDEFLSNEEFRRRFRNESRAIAVLSHPNIVKIYDVSFGDHVHYIVMEYVDGITLKEFLEQQKVIRWKEAVHFTTQILRALQHAHEKGIVHRDIKPQNIMLLPDGTVKVMDFGIARFSRSETRTVTDKAIGSVHYISPEQARGEVTDDKADIYSVGVMLYEMLTGRLPFEADNAVSVAIMQMQADPTPPREINDTIPEGLEAITLRAMQKDPQNRYESAAEMLRDIDEFKRNPSVSFEYQYFVDETPTRYVDSIDDVQNGEDDGFYDDEEPAEEEEKTRTIPVLAGIAIAFVAAVVVFIVVMLFLNPQLLPWNKSPEVVVPNFVGQNYKQIDDNAELKAFKDNLIVDTYEYNLQYPEDGYIYYQDIQPEMKIRSNQKIKIKVSKGAPPVAVPDVYGKSRSEAINLLTEAQFKIEEIQELDQNATEGTVLRTDPARKTEAPQGSTIKVYVAVKDVKYTQVPPVKGLDEATAMAEITKANLKPNVVRVDQVADAGKVISQTPGSSTYVPQYSTVTIQVSTGKEPTQSVSLSVTMPKGFSQVDIDVYRNGEKQSDLSKKGYLVAGGDYKFTLTGSGVDTVNIVINGNLSNPFKTYKVDYAAATATLVSTNEPTPPTSSTHVTSTLPSSSSTEPGSSSSTSSETTTSTEE